ncbi:MAG TPA: Gfo/Idh/MocA family oxidoreductase [Sumerlaeia bacterium]|nr:Gfo/Idh/MocA family oxidoreductase [Sumerlaeia bacterium]
MIELGIIGCGGMGSHHARTFHRMEKTEVTRVADLVEEKAVKLGREIGARPTTDFREMLPDVDAVVICTEPFRRTDVVVECARAGMDMFAEKPLALNLREADQILEAVEQAGVLFMTGYVLRYTHPYKLLCETFNSGELGRLVNCWTRRYMPCSMVGTWYGDQEKSGGIALDFASHDIDLLRWMGGDVKTAFAHADRVRPAIRADEHAQALLAFENGGMAALDVSWSSWLDETSLGVIGTEGSIVVDRSGTVRKKIGDKKEQILSTQGAMSVNLAGDLGQKDGDGNIQAVASREETIQEHFVRCLEEGVEPKTNGRDARGVLQTVLAIHESARTGRAVHLNGTG